jgi:hypothetical protein
LNRRFWGRGKSRNEDRVDRAVPFGRRTGGQSRERDRAPVARGFPLRWATCASSSVPTATVVFDERSSHCGGRKRTQSDSHWPRRPDAIRCDDVDCRHASPVSWRVGLPDVAGDSRLNGAVELDDAAGEGSAIFGTVRPRTHFRCSSHPQKNCACGASESSSEKDLRYRSRSHDALTSHQWPGPRARLKIQDSTAAHAIGARAST